MESRRAERALLKAVDDRLHGRYDHRFDIWKATKQEAFEFGRRRLVVEVL